MSYKVIRLDLSKARDREPIMIPGNEITAHIVPAPFWVRLGSRDADPILVDRPGRVIRCSAPMESVYISNTAGAGVAELVIGDLQLNFSSAPADSEPGPIVHLLANMANTGNWGDDVGSARFNAKLGLTNTNMRTSGGYNADTGLIGPRMECYQDTSNFGAFHLTVPLIQLHPYYALESQIRRELGRWKVEDTIMCTGSGVRLAWGLGEVGLGNNDYCGPHFVSMPGEEIRAVLSDKNGAVHNVGTGRGLVGPVRLGISLEVVGDAPVTRWYIDGKLAALHRGAWSFDAFPSVMQTKVSWYAKLIYAEAGGRGSLYPLLGAGLKLYHFPQVGT